MKTFLIMALCLIAISAEAKTAMSDTLNCYIINNKQISKFDGSQLTNMTIKSYTIETNKSGKNVVRTHKITTAPSANADNVVVVGYGKTNDKDVKSGTGDIVIVDYGVRVKDNNGQTISVSEKNGTIIYVVDGEKMAPEEVHKIQATEIKSMEILKGSAAKKYTDKNDVDVIIITTNKRKK